MRQAVNLAKWGNVDGIMNIVVNYSVLQNTARMIKSQRTTWVGYVARMRKTTNSYKILAGKSKWQRSFERQENNIKI